MYIYIYVWIYRNLCSCTHTSMCIRIYPHTCTHTYTHPGTRNNSKLLHFSSKRRKNFHHCNPLRCLSIRVKAQRFIRCAATVELQLRLGLMREQTTKQCYRSCHPRGLCLLKTSLMCGSARLQHARF